MSREQGVVNTVNTFKYPSQEIVQKNLEFFKEAFTAYFMKRLDIIGSQTKKLLPLKEGEKSGKAVSGVSWARDGAAAAPIVGGFLSLGLKIPEELMKKKLAEHQRVRTERVNEAVQGFHEEWIQGILTATAQELCRIYEYQIGLLADGANVVKLAESAVDIAISHFSKIKNQGKEFNRDTLLKAIMAGEKSYSTSHTTKSVNSVASKLEKKGKEAKLILSGGTIQDINNADIQEKNEGDLHTCISDLTWRIPSVFTKPGIRKKIAQKNQFECIDCEGSKPEKYGYRGQLKEPDGKGGYIDFSDRLKTHSVLKIDEENQELYKFHRNYNSRTIYVLAEKGDIKSYEDYLKDFKPDGDEENPQSFNEFLGEKYKRKTTKVNAVYRGETLSKEVDFSGADFSETDFSGIKIEKFNVQKAMFTNCIFTYTQFIDVDFKDADLKHTQMNFAQFKGNTSLQGVNINQADFSFTEADKDINFSGVTDYKGTCFRFSNFYLIKNDKSVSSEKKGGLRFIAVAEGADISEFNGKLVQIGTDTKIAQGSTAQDVDNVNRIHDNSIAALKKDEGTTFIGFASKSTPTGNSTIEQIASRGEVTANPYLQSTQVSKPRQSELTNKHGMLSEAQKQRKDSYHARTKVYILDTGLIRSTVNDDEFTVTLEKNGCLTICWSNHGKIDHKSFTNEEATTITQKIKSLGLNAGQESQDAFLIKEVQSVCDFIQKNKEKEEDDGYENLEEREESQRFNSSKKN